MKTTPGDDVCVAVDEEVLIKAASDVLIFVRNAWAGTDLGQPPKAGEREILNKLNWSARLA